MNSYNITTTNDSFVEQSCPKAIDTAAGKGMKIAALCAIMFCALVFNSLVITVFVKNPSLHKTVNYFLVNMAVSDLLIPIVTIPNKLLILISGSNAWQVKGTVGAALCKLQPLLQDLPPAVSILSIICITVDRFYAVVRPLRITLIPDKTRAFIIGLIWILAILTYSHYFHTLNLHSRRDGEAYCMMDWSPLDHAKSMTIVVTFVATLYGIFPWILVVVLYNCMLVGLRRAKARIEANATTLVQHRRIHSVTRQAFIIVFVFVLCNFPQAVMFLKIAYDYKFICSPLPYWGHLFFASEFLVLANTALHPCICLFLNENYRNGLWRLLKFNSSDRVYPEVARGEMREENLTRST